VLSWAPFITKPGQWQDEPGLLSLSLCALTAAHTRHQCRLPWRLLAALQAL